MRKLVVLVCVLALSGLSASKSADAGIIPSWQDASGRIGFFPISNEVSFYKNVDDAGVNRGETVQFILINRFKLFTEFSFEFTADYNFDYTPGLDNDHYVELSLVKEVTPFVSLNVQRIISSFEPESINQFGFRLVF